MKKRIKQVSAFVATLIFSCLIAVPVFGLTESEVQTQVNANGTGVVTGNLFIWFLCAVAFLKISQKIDSFMSSLGINVGHTGGSMLAEAMIAMRGVVTAKQFTNGFGHYSKGSTGSDSGSFMSGGLSGIVSRGVTNNAVKNVTGNSGNGLGGKMYNSSVNKGGSFANTVISKVANGDIKSTGSITGKGAESALMSYMGYTALGTDAKDILYEKKVNETGFMNHKNYVECLKRLVQRGLVAQGQGYNGIDALYDLLSGLYIIPISENIFLRIISFIKFTLFSKIPFSSAKKLFSKDKRDDGEKKIMKLANQSILSTAEMIKCINNNALKFSTNEELMDALYYDEYTTSDNIAYCVRSFPECCNVLKSVAKLYLRKQIIFERNL